ncbi:Pr6Pr family membrane protein [Nocardioides sp.]|uniref:Pr6Pr family membrane protein n=1 Tax=Nocardioides sp. TaxID=35761 RepID=UPI003529940B
MTATPAAESIAEPAGLARPACLLNAGVAWFGVLLTAFLSGMGWYDDLPPEPGLYGGRPYGAAGAAGRLFDTFSYFTIWSNVVVAVSVTLLLARPLRASLARRVLRLDGLLMITVTAIVYQLLLAPSAVITGWSRLTDPILHIVTPVVTLAVWLGWGPRGWVTLRMVPLALVVPVLWIGWMLARGAVTDTYPYDFVNVSAHGYGSVTLTLLMILVFGLVVTAVLWAVEALLGRRRTRTVAAEA